MKEIKDYLHLYLGCDVMWSGVRKANLIDTNKINCNLFFDGARYQTSISNIKPILRPLSSMTEDEVNNAITPMCYGLQSIEGNERLRQAGELTKYLLSKHFDLFGLIEAGLAIDATTLKTPA